MKVFYHCYGAAHSSVVAAFLHLGRLSSPPTAQQLRDLPYFDRQEKASHGRIFFLGQDGEGNDIYIFARRNVAQVAVRVLTGMAYIFGLPAEDYLFVNTTLFTNWLLTLGGILSRQLGLVWPGRLFVTKGAQKAFPDLLDLVTQVKKVIKQEYPPKYPLASTRASTAALCLEKQANRALGSIPPRGSQVPRGSAGTTRREGARPGQEKEDPSSPDQPEVIFYQCYGSTHSSVVSGAIHLGQLPTRRCPAKKEILALPLFDQVANNQIGRPFFLGIDGDGRRVYAIGLASQPALLKRLASDFLALHGITDKQYRFYNALAHARFLVRLGGFLSRRLGLVRLGRPLTVLGIQQNYFAFVRLVERVQSELTQPEGKGKGRS